MKSTNNFNIHKINEYFHNKSILGDKKVYVEGIYDMNRDDEDNINCLFDTSDFNIHPLYWQAPLKVMLLVTELLKIFDIKNYLNYDWIIRDRRYSDFGYDYSDYADLITNLIKSYVRQDFTIELNDANKFQISRIRKLKKAYQAVDKRYEEYVNNYCFIFYTVHHRWLRLNTVDFFNENILSLLNLPKDFPFYEGVLENNRFVATARDESILDMLLSLLMLNLYINIRFILSSEIPVITINTIEQWIMLRDFFDDENNKKYEWIFRGQRNSHWKLIPSFFRNFNHSEATVIDMTKVLEYLSPRLEEYRIKFSDSKNPTIRENIKDEYESKFLYEASTFLQHEASGTHLLDFTSDFIIATSFSLNWEDEKDGEGSIFIGTNKRKIANQLYFLELLSEMKIPKKGNKINFDPKSPTKDNVYSYIKDFSYFSFINNGFINQDFSLLIEWINKVGFFNEQWDYRSVILNQKFNDRMKIQRGLFVLLNDIFSYDGQSFSFLPREFDAIIKCNISCEVKAEIKKYIEEYHTRCIYANLLDPYKRIFVE